MKTKSVENASNDVVQAQEEIDEALKDMPTTRIVRRMALNVLPSDRWTLTSTLLLGGVAGAGVVLSAMPMAIAISLPLGAAALSNAIYNDSGEARELASRCPTPTSMRATLSSMFTKEDKGDTAEWAKQD